MKKITLSVLLLALATVFSFAATSGAVNWLDDSVPSLYETYKADFDYVGIACEYDSWNGIKELVNDNVCTGLKKHANTITMGNEFKPDSFFGYQWNGNGKKMVDFTGSNGKTIKVPASLNYSTVDKCLSQCKKHGLKMRGHVLVWHSQTPESFFADNYVAKTSNGLITNLADKDTMCARQEWYIKSVLQHVAEWEKTNNNGEHIIWAWDVVNEAMADDAFVGTQEWVRGATASTKDKAPNAYPAGSRWYQIYGSEEFIIDAFRFANAYAPADVKLCYNDYNEYMNWSGGWKTKAICKLIDELQTAEAKKVDGRSVRPRIDAMGMQSHVGVSWPGLQGYETAIKEFLKKGVDIHVTELDFSAETPEAAAKCYKEYNNLFRKYGNQGSAKNKITCVTVWGINNKTSWIYKGKVKYPLLFDGYETTDSFWAIINGVKK